jgi:hypothetical protein
VAITGLAESRVKVTAAAASPLGLVTVMATAPTLDSMGAVAAIFRWAESMKAEATGEPFQRATQLTAKLAPVTPTSRPSLPAGALAGVSESMEGRGGSSTKVRALETAPPGLTTVMAAPTPARRVSRSDGTNPITCVPLRYVVGRAVSFHIVREPETKPLPVMLRGNEAEPVAADGGFRAVSTGAWGNTVKVAAFEVVPYWLTS